MKVHVGTENRVKKTAVENVFKKVFGNEVQVKKVAVDTGVPEQPFGKQVAQGAIKRAKKAVKTSYLMY